MTPPDSPNATRYLDFQDRRPPHEIQLVLERELMVLLQGVMEAGRLEFRGRLNVNGARCDVVLGFEAALAETNGYSLRLVMSSGDLPAEQHDYHRQASAGWFDLWTRHFTKAGPALREEGSLPRYDALATQASGAESHLVSAGGVRQEILAGLRAGGSFATAHKEGGTNISFQNGKFVRVDYGESNDREEFRDEAALLDCLWNLYQWEASRGACPGPPSELDRWKLILRLLRPAKKAGRGSAEGRHGHSTVQGLLAFLIAILAVGGMVMLRGGPSGYHRFSEKKAAPAPRAQLPSFEFKEPR